MLYKRITRHFADPSEGIPPATLLKIASGSGRIDVPQMQKMAKLGSAPLLMGVSPDPGHSLLHVIAVGAHEKWGSNSNADTFNREACRVYPLDKSASKVAFRDLKGGLRKHLSSYEKEGGLYFEHFNRTKGAKKQGMIKKAMYNDKMDRGELIIQVEDAKHGPLLSSIEKGDPTFVSQGCSVPEDVCSACLNAAKSPRDYCDHMKRHKLEMLAGGGRVFCYNSEPTFHDISVVKVPAFIPAFVLGMRRGQEKTAAHGRADSPELLEFTYGAGEFVKAAGIDIPATAVASYLMDARPAKMALLMKLAKLEKELPGQVVDAVVAGSRLSPAKRQKLVATVSSKAPKEVVAAAKVAGVVLPSSLFHDILLAEKPQGGGDGGYRNALKTVYSDLMEDPEALLEVVDNDDYKSDRPCASTCGLEEFADQLSPDPDKALGLAEKASLSGKTASFEPDSEPDEGDRALAREYARYMLEALEGQDGAALKVAVARKGRI